MSRDQALEEGFDYGLAGDDICTPCLKGCCEECGGGYCCCDSPLHNEADKAVDYHATVIETGRTVLASAQHGSALLVLLLCLNLFSGFLLGAFRLTSELAVLDWLAVIEIVHAVTLIMGVLVVLWITSR